MSAQKIREEELLIRSSTRVLVLASLCVSVPSAPAYSQGGSTSSVTGVVVDTAGGVVPGATVVVKSNATGTTFETVTNSSGAFSVPALDAGIYTVTVSLTGFKTAVVNDVRVAARHARHGQGRRSRSAA